MKQNKSDRPEVLLSSHPTPRRPFLRAIAGAGVLGAFGLPALSGVASALPGVTIEYKRCKVAFVTNASALDAIAVYYADSDGERQAAYGIDPTTTDPRGYEPIVVEYDEDEDRTQIQVAEELASLVCIIAEAGSDRTVQTNSTEVCVPQGFNTAPTASFTVSEDPAVGEPVTFTSTATDSDDPERLYYEWDLDDDGIYEATGQTVSTTYGTAGDVSVHHRVTDDCGMNNDITQTVSLKSSALFGQVAKLTADDGENYDNFGISVSVDGDTALVGVVYGDPDGKSDAGSAYVFTKSGTSWIQEQKLIASDPQSFDLFGSSVSLDGATALVGASNNDSGAAYVFTLSNGTWSQQQKLTADDAEAGDAFGVSVSVDGDTALVGAYLEVPDGMPETGSAYVFTRSGGNWTQQQKLVADDAQAGDDFGISVSVDGNTALIGAYSEDQVNKYQAGSAYVFTRSGGNWTQQQKLVADDAQTGDRFGISVSVDEDTALVGAYREAPDGKTDAGSAYVFTRSNGAWTQQGKLTADDADAGDNFGFAVSVDGDTALVGAYSEDPDGAPSGGSAYVFTPSGTIWSQQQKLTADDAAFGDFFGFAVSVDGDTALVGASGDDFDGTTSAGSAYIFSR